LWANSPQTGWRLADMARITALVAKELAKNARKTFLKNMPSVSLLLVIVIIVRRWKNNELRIT